jgi:hypothetical protein
MTVKRAKGMTALRKLAKGVIGTAPWLNWIEQPPPKGQVAGSNPAGVTKKTNKI